MNKEEFLKKLIEDLDLDEREINESSALHLTSLMQLSLISFLDGNFNLRVKASDLKDIDSVDKLMILIGKANIK